MSGLTLPTNQQVYDFWGDEADADDPDRMALMIQLAADLLWMATGIDTDPVDPRQARFVEYAIEDMAIYLYASRDSISETYSPFNSERIGSYSYMKMFRGGSKSVLSGQTDVPFFDLLVNAMVTGVYDSEPWLTSENVFLNQYHRYDRSETLLHPDITRIPYSGKLFSDPNSVLYDPVINDGDWSG